MRMLDCAPGARGVIFRWAEVGSQRVIYIGDVRNPALPSLFPGPRSDH